ncbi:MAG: 30S ribosomal protein S4 [Patescibacteria group bacterium]
MARYTGPRNRLSRREGVDLGHKTVGSKAHAMLLKRLQVPPGQHGPKGTGKMSGFGQQLREKQKVKRMYAVLERQFRKAFERSRIGKGNTGEKLLEIMERRLDNVLYRLLLVPTRAASRQIVSHGHVFVDGKKVNIPSFEVSVGHVVTLDQTATEIPAVKKMLDEKNIKLPEWLERKGPSGRVVRLPVRSDIQEDIAEQYIVEHYSR